MRAARPIAWLLLAVTLAGCSGFSIGVRQDKEDRALVSRAFARHAAGRPFAAGTLLDKSWTRLFVFRGGITTGAIEERIGIPFPESGEATPAGSSYLVFADDETVISSFSSAAGVSLRCLEGGRAPVEPGTPFVVIGARGSGAAGPSRLSTVAAAARCR